MLLFIILKKNKTNSNQVNYQRFKKLNNPFRFYEMFYSVKTQRSLIKTKERSQEPDMMWQFYQLHL